MSTKSEKFIHPELKLNEVLLSNINSPGYENLKWKTKRKGKVAYDGKGKLTNNEDWFPVFIESKELLESGESLYDARKEIRHSLG